MKRSRTQNVLLNTSIALVCQLIYLLVSFICRTVFTKSLGAEYLGITGLFTNILTILSFAELGIGSALVFRMYEPLAKEDWNKVSQYIRLYKIAYRIILTIVICIGLILIPIIPYLVVTPNVKENIVLLYILYLGQTAVTYIFAYKKSLLIADQKSYIVNITTQIFNILMNVLQCIFLVFTHDFVIYCVCNIVCNVLNNIACSIYVDKNYSQLKKTVYGDLSTYEKKELLKDVIKEELQNIRKIIDKAEKQSNDFFVNIQSVICSVIRYKNESDFFKMLIKESEMFNNEKLKDNLKIIDSEIKDYIKSKVEKAVNNKEIVVKDVNIITFLIYKMYIALIIDWNEDNAKLDEKDIADNVLQILKYGIKRKEVE